MFFLGFWKSDAKATQRTLKDYLTAQKPQDRVFKTDEFLAQGYATPAHDLVDFIEGKVFKPTPDGLVYKEAPSTLLDSNGAKVQQWSGPKKSRNPKRGQARCLRDSAGAAAGYVSDTRCRLERHRRPRGDEKCHPLRLSLTASDGAEPKLEILTLAPRLQGRARVAAQISRAGPNL